MPKWVYPTAFVFLLFLIFTEPTTAGSIAGEFAAFLAEMLGALGEFLAGLFGGASEPSGDVSSEGVIVEAPQSSETHTHEFTE